MDILRARSFHPEAQSDLGLAPVTQQNWASEVFPLPCVVSGVYDPHPSMGSQPRSVLCSAVLSQHLSLAWPTCAWLVFSGREEGAENVGRRMVAPQSLVQRQGHLAGSVSISWRLEPIWVRLILAPRRTCLLTHPWQRCQMELCPLPPSSGIPPSPFLATKEPGVSGAPWVVSLLNSQQGPLVCALTRPLRQLGKDWGLGGHGPWTQKP